MGVGGKVIHGSGRHCLLVRMDGTALKEGGQDVDEKEVMRGRKVTTKEWKVETV